MEMIKDCSTCRYLYESVNGVHCRPCADVDDPIYWEPKEIETETEEGENEVDE